MYVEFKKCKTNPILSRYSSSLTAAAFTGRSTHRRERRSLRGAATEAGRGNRNLDAGASSQAGFGRAANGVVGEVRLDIAEGSPAGAVDEKTVESVTGAAARRDEPSVLGQATSRTEAGGAGGGEGTKATRVGPVAIALDPEHPGASLGTPDHALNPSM